ncbi:unnamed protein product [Sphagnum balticum]
MYEALEQFTIGLLQEAYGGDPTKAIQTLHRPAHIYNRLNCLQLASLSKSEVSYAQSHAGAHLSAGDSGDAGGSGGGESAMARRHELECVGHNYWTGTVRAARRDQLQTTHSSVAGSLSGTIH